MSYKLSRADASDIIKPLPTIYDNYAPALISKAPSAADVNLVKPAPVQLPDRVYSASTVSFPFRYHKDFDLVHEDYWSNRQKYFSPLYDKVNHFNDSYYLNKARPYWTNYRSDLFEYSHPYYRTRYTGPNYEPYYRTSYYSPYRASLYDNLALSFYKALGAYRNGITDFSTLNHNHITRNYLSKVGMDPCRLYEPKTELLYYRQPHYHRPRKFLTAWT
ncbi:unnamed protein product [Bursaphelenchus okinawaensis]|uniref:Uncharacterized protein n=1 Tax=Bursaphelenchus okinawaensis TaxID=465554 RepID=A0A811KJU2_9BILA|nr:unnamed protein product [Bursaphelenchus okinawaensis]CAG9104416.1 unnamed protein product [Bursaphelenchus okinawaensis]